MLSRCFSVFLPPNVYSQHHSLIYPKPKIDGAQYYFGLGVTAGDLRGDRDKSRTRGSSPLNGWFQTDMRYVGPTFVFGREFSSVKKGRQFFQFSIDTLFDISPRSYNRYEGVIPAFSFAYGWGF